METGDGQTLKQAVSNALEKTHKGSADYPFRVELANYVTPGRVEVHLHAALTESGLVLEGQDLGDLVKQLFGDSDYEYWVTVGWQDVARVEGLLTSELGVEKGRPVLEMMRMAWESGMFQTDVDFRKWLETHEISSEFASYA